jgi:hypothetical protein
MAVAQVYQREVVEVPFSLPDGQILPHPALVISCDDLQNIEPGLFYAVLISTKNHHPELTIPIQGEWLSSPLSQQSYFVTHIISQFNCDDVIARHNCFLRQPYFDQVIDRIIGTIVDGDW